MNRISIPRRVLFASIAFLVAAPAKLVSAAIVVSDSSGLAVAVEAANAGGETEIVLRDGVYTLSDMLWIEADGVTVRSASGRRDSVVIEGRGMEGDVSYIFNVNGSHFTVRDVTLRGVANHAIQLQIDVDGVLIRNCHILDTYEQMVKVAYDPALPELSSDGGVLEYCLLEYSAGVGPQYYIGGIDAHNAKNWIVRNNVFRAIRSPADEAAEFAVHFWSDSENTIVEKNYIINCDRGIGFGMGERGHHGGIIRNNMIYHDATEDFADVGIALESADGALVCNNTVYQEHSYPNTIEYRFEKTTGVRIINNLTNRPIASRDGGQSFLSRNTTDAGSSWFASLFVGDLHLAYAVPEVVDQAEALADLVDDIDGGVRPWGAGYDRGADEFGSGSYGPLPESGDAVADIAVNGSDGPLSLKAGAAITITVSCDPGYLEGVSGDWWLATETPAGPLFYRASGWRREPAPAYQGALFRLDSYEVLTMSSRGLAPGFYTVYFSVDGSADGSLSWSSLQHDRVLLEIVGEATASIRHRGPIGLSPVLSGEAAPSRPLCILSGR